MKLQYYILLSNDYVSDDSEPLRFGPFASINFRGEDLVTTDHNDVWVDSEWGQWWCDGGSFQNMQVIAEIVPE